MSTERDAARTVARNILETHTAKPEEVSSAIVGIGKPYDAQVIGAHAALVATYLDHPDHIVRHEAIWFLGSWGHLPEYASRIHDSAHMDADVANRAYAARSLGSILKQEKDPVLTQQILAFVEDEQEEIEVRLSAYSGLLYAWNRPDKFAFLIGENTISEVDREFLIHLYAWIQGKTEMPPVTPSRGLLRSLLNAWRNGLI